MGPARTVLLATALLLALGAVAGAQAYFDAFAYPDGTNVPGWTEKRGDWIIAGGRLHSTAHVGHGYITKDGPARKDSVTEVTVFYEGTTGIVQMGGLCARETGGATLSNLLMCKIQDNTAGTAGFDILYNYEYTTGGSAATQAVPGAPVSARLRFIVVDNAATMLADTNLDGVFDQTLSRAATSILGFGDVGCSGGFLSTLTRSSAMDDFALFDAVLTATGTPRVGGTLALQLRGVSPGAAYQAAASFGNAGIPIDTRRVPLTPDALLTLSLVLTPVFSGFAGLLDTSASAAAAINIPNIGALAGLRFHVAFVELGALAPSGIAAISNDHAVVVVP